jgi:hypothetical protein
MMATGHVAHRREAALQRVFQHAQAMGRAVGLAQQLDLLHRQGAGQRVNVAVDQPRHQRASAGVDHQGRSRGRDRRADFLDAAIGHPHRQAALAVGRMTVENARVADEEVVHGP